MNILRRIGRAISRLNRRLASGSTGQVSRDVTMLQEAEHDQFEAGEDKESE